MRVPVVAAIAVAFLAACASTPRQTREEGGATAAISVKQTSKFDIVGSQLAVGAIPNAIVHDARRNRDVSMSIEYPARGGPYPVIIFSHGYGASKESYTALSASWAGRGYIVIKPDHADAGTLRALGAERRREREASGQSGQQSHEQRQRRESVRNNQKGNQPAPPPEPPAETAWQSKTPADWTDRVADIRLVLDSFAALQDKFPELSGKIDTAHVGVGGDSYGALTAMLAGGAVSFKTEPPLRLGDSRIGALLLISPQGIGDQFGFTAESWKDVRIPAMVLTGSLDRAPAGDGDPKWRRDPFAYSAAGDKYFVSFENARHATFGGQVGLLSDDEMQRQTTPVYYPQTDPMTGRPVYVPQEQASSGPRGPSRGMVSDRRIFEAARLASAAFWDAYLKSSADAREFLQKDLETMGVKATVERR